MENDCIQISGYTEQPAIEGTTIKLSCLDGLILSGPTVSICMGNGEWEPDLRLVECKGISGA